VLVKQESLQPLEFACRESVHPIIGRRIETEEISSAAMCRNTFFNVLRDEVCFADFRCEPVTSDDAPIRDSDADLNRAM